MLQQQCHRATAIRHLREQFEPPLPQAELARLVGISQRTLSRYERGERRPDLDVAIRIAVALGAGVERVFWHVTDDAQHQIGSRRR